MTRRGLALLDLLGVIVIVWFVAWLTNFISTKLEIHLFLASWGVVSSYLLIMYLFIAIRKVITKSTEDGHDEPDAP